MMAEEGSYGAIGGPPIETTRTTAFGGKTRTFAGLMKVEWAFLCVSFLNIVAAISMTGFSMDYVVKNVCNNDTSNSNGNDVEGCSDFAFSLVLLINIVFCGFYVIHGVLREREFELYAFIAGLLVVLIYCIVEYSLNTDGHKNPIKLPRLITSCVLAPPNIVLAWMVAREFGWLEFKIVGASEALQKMYRQASLFSTLLKFDFQVAVSFVVLVSTSDENLDVKEKVTLGVGLPFCFLWLVSGWVAMRKEIKWLMVTFCVLAFVPPIYVIYRIVEEYHQFYNDDTSSSDSKLVVGVIAAGLFEMLVRVILLAEAVIVLRNFKKGLKERAFEVLAAEKTSLLANRKSRV